MNFQQQTITLCGDKGKTEIQAMVAVGVGLAYHPNLDCDDDENTFNITHIGSGHNILKSRSKQLMLDALPDELSAQRFIEAIAHVVDWNLSEKSLRALARTPDQRIFADLCQAYYETAEEVAKEETHLGTCLQCDRFVTALSPAGLCEGCVMEAMIDE